MPCRLSCAVPSLLLLAAGVAIAAEPTIAVTTARGGETYIVALDELQAQGTAPKKVPARLRGMTVDGKARLAEVASLEDLDAVAEEMSSAGASVEAVLYPLGCRNSATDRSVLSRQVAVGLHKGADAAALAARHGCRVARLLSPDTALFEPLDRSLLAATRVAADLATDAAVSFAEPQVQRLLAARYTPRDPLFGTPLMPFPWPNGRKDYGQWHLKVAPFGMQVEPVWGSTTFAKDGYTGKNVLVSMVDTGVEINHPDLLAFPDNAQGRIRADLSWDFLRNIESVNPPDNSNGTTTNENHGTVVAGLIAAREGNGKGGVGVAFDARVVPLRFITGREPNADPMSTNLDSGGQMPPFGIDVWPGKSDAQFRDVITYQLNPRLSGATISVSNNAWGNAGLAGGLNAPGSVAVNAMESAVTIGRQGRGLILVWSAGNDHVTGYPYSTDFMPEDNASFDGWLTRFTIPVGALNRAGRKTSFSEIGPALLVCAPGGEFDFNPYPPPGVGSPIHHMHGLVSTDRVRRSGLWAPTTVDPGYNPGEQDWDGDDTLNGVLNQTSTPDPYEDCPQWINGLYYPFGDGTFDNVNEDTNGNKILDAGEDLDGDNYLDTGEDFDHDRKVDLVYEPDLDGDGFLDCGERHFGIDVNGDNVYSWTEDLNGNGIFDFGEDIDGDGNFDDINEDINKDLWPLTDPTTPNEGSDGFFDVFEDLAGLGNTFPNFPPNEDFDSDGRFDGVDYPLEDINGDHLWNGGDYTVPYNVGLAAAPYEPASTSFAAANLSGVVALMLQARPELTWRDVQCILAHRARKPGRNLDGYGWIAGWAAYPSVPAFILHGPPLTTARYDAIRGLRYNLFTYNSVGLAYNHWYGYGAVNAMTAVLGCDVTNAGTTFPGFPVSAAASVANPGAKYWPLLPAEETPIVVDFTRANAAAWPLNGLIPRSGISDPGDNTINPRFELDLTVPPVDSDFIVESVEMKVDITGVHRSNLTIALASPAGTVAQVPWRRYQAGYGEGTETTNPGELKYTFTFRNFIGENPNDLPLASGATSHWRLIIVNSAEGGGGFKGQLNAATMTIHGHRPYPTPGAPSTDVNGVPTGGSRNFDIKASGIRQNAAGEVTVTKAYWYDNDLDTSAQVVDPDPLVDAADDLAAPVRVVELTTELKTSSSMNVKVPAGIIPVDRSPGDAVLFIGNPALPIGQFPIQSQAGALWAVEDRYQRDIWETYTAVNLTHVGTTPLAIERRVKRCDLGTEILFRYSRPPTISAMPDIMLKAGTSTGTPVVVTFSVDDPDISTPNIGPPGFSRSSTDETLVVTRSIFNQSVIPKSSSSVVLLSAGPNAQGTGTYQFSGVIEGTSGLSLIEIDVTDGVSITRGAFRIGVLTDEKASGCGGGMGLALIGGPLAIWLFGRRRRSASK